ncbi:unnamed protein product [Victoria cruziana]
MLSTFVQKRQYQFHPSVTSHAVKMVGRRYVHVFHAVRDSDQPNMVTGPRWSAVPDDPPLHRGGSPNFRDHRSKKSLTLGSRCG